MKPDISIEQLLDIEQKDNYEQLQIFQDDNTEYKKHWWGMPEFYNVEISPDSSVTIHFATAQDREEFIRRTSINIRKAKSIWYPAPKIHGTNGQFYYVGEKCDSKYPVCIPSKGRWDIQTTGHTLDELGVSYKFFVEQTEAQQYIDKLGQDKVVVMPFNDLGQGSIPARNYIWDWAQEREHKRHWILDDNLGRFDRCHVNRRLRIRGGRIFNAMEDFVDRYKNIALAGPHERGFVKTSFNANLKPYLLNTRIYSCILIDTSLNYRWRGRYNEDTDLSLRVLKDGYVTCLFHSILMDKPDTAFSRTNKPMRGGNTDNVYNTNDHRLKFAMSLREQHPDCVKVTFKFGRYHHHVDYSAFANNRLLLKDGIIPIPAINNYGMMLHKDNKNENASQSQ